MAFTEHYKGMYANSIKQLAGSPNRAILKALVGFKGGLSGEVAYLDAISPSSTFASDVATGGNDLNWQAITDQKYTRSQFEAGTQNIANYLKMLTPHKEITKQRTLVTPKLIESGHQFDKHDSMFEMTDPKSRTLQQQMREIFYAEDYLVYSALKAATTNRSHVLDGATPTTVTFASSFPNQVIPHTDADLHLSLELFTQIKARYKKNFIENERIFMLISPDHQRWLIDDYVDTITSRDFVDGRYLETGEIPDLFGIALVPHNLCTNNEFYCWTQEGITWGEFMPLTSEMGVSPDFRFSTIAYTSETADCQREDDLRIIQGTVAVS